MIIETFPVGWLQCNCTILGDEETREAIVIDPGDDPQEILARLDKHGLTAKQIVCTHTHIDHVGAIFELQERLQRRHRSTKPTCSYSKSSMCRRNGSACRCRSAASSTILSKTAMRVACRGIEIGVIHTPGHTPGSTTLHLPGDRNILFTGDTLFAQSIGRTDLWGGSHPQIITSIQKKLMTFDDDTLVISGHGQSTTIGHERRYNPFLK